MSRFWVSLLAVAFCSPLAGQTNAPAFDIKGTSLSELMSLKITSLSKKEESVNHAPAAVYVLSHDEIKRMGVTHIAEALRYVPGVEVARIDASRWAISIRGFNSRSANKLLVMVDGRTIYSTFFSGVLWEEKDLVLADIDRIEVIRGPGGAIWGANAVNGVINIITKDAKQTTKTLIEGGGTSENSAMAQGRYGWKISDKSYARVYTKYRENDDTGTLFTNDDGHHSQAGFRLDHWLTEDNQMTLQGDVYQGEIGDLNTTEEPGGEENAGGNILFNWMIQENQNRSHKLQTYYDNTDLDTGSIDDKRHTWDLSYEVQQNWQQHELVSGVSYRHVRDEVVTDPAGLIAPERRTDETFSAFFQDDIALFEDDVHLILGTKYENNDYTGSEWQPNARISYYVWESLFWASWSQAVRTPTRLESNITIPSLNGENFDAEKATVYELGWRKRWPESFQLDATLYQADYDDLLSLEADGIRNKISGDTQGIELSASMQPRKDWLLRINYTHAEMDLEADADSTDSARAESIEGAMPENMVQIISMLDINKHWQLNTFLRYVDELKTNEVDSYTVADISLAWNNGKGFSARLTGRNLGDEHAEWSSDAPLEDEYGLYLKWEL